MLKIMMPSLEVVMLKVTARVVVRMRAVMRTEQKVTKKVMVMAMVVVRMRVVRQLVLMGVMATGVVGVAMAGRVLAAVQQSAMVAATPGSLALMHMRMLLIEPQCSQAGCKWTFVRTVGSSGVALPEGF
jgi:hypothetical protein